jgi:hypothetical protein
MIVKPLLSLQQSSIGKTTHAPNAATCHMSHIRRGATKFQAELMPDGRPMTCGYFDKAADRPGVPINARICDRLMIALPREMTREQRWETVAAFMHQLGQERIAWCAAHHDSGHHAANPHVSIVFRDADVLTGKKVMGTTTSFADVRKAEDNGWKVPPRTTTRDIRALWCAMLNKPLHPSIHACGHLSIDKNHASFALLSASISSSNSASTASASLSSFA